MFLNLSIQRSYYLYSLTVAVLCSLMRSSTLDGKTRLASPCWVFKHSKTGLAALRPFSFPITQSVQFLKNEAKRCFLFHVEHLWGFFMPCFQLPLTLEVRISSNCRDYMQLFLISFSITCVCFLSLR